MAKAKFIRDFDFHVTPRAIIAFKAGWTGTTKRSALDAAVAAGAAIDLDAEGATKSAASASSEAAVDGKRS